LGLRINNYSRFENKDINLTEPFIKEHEAIKQMLRKLDKICYKFLPNRIGAEPEMKILIFKMITI